MKCPKCGAELVRENTVLFCETYGCRYSQDAETDLESEMFYHYAFDSYYPLLAHEYKVLYGFIENKNYYGAFLEYKDVVEIILKVPVLIALNYLWRKHDYTSDKEKDIIKFLLKRSATLSLGDWKVLCRRFIELYNSLISGNIEATREEVVFASRLCPLLKAVFDFYERTRIVGWRNEKIGHGALQSDLESNPEELITYIKKLKEHLEANEPYYRLIRIINASNESGHNGISVQLEEDVYEQSFFTLSKDNTMSVFDSYSRNSAYVLNYVEARKEKSGVDLSELFRDKTKKYMKTERIATLPMWVFQMLFFTPRISKIY